MKSIEAGELPNAQQRKGILVVEENVEQGDIKLAVFVIYCRAIGWITILLVISIFFIGQGFQIYTNIWLSRWSSAGANASKDISYWLGVYTALGLAYSLSNMLTSFSLAFGSIHASKNLHETVVKRLLKAPLSFFDTTLLGRIVNRLSKDIYTIDEALPNSLKSFLNTFFSVLGTIFIIAFATPKFLIIVLPLLLLYIVIQRFYVSSSRQLKRLESVSRSPIFAHFQETNHGVSTIRAYGREERFIKENIAVLEYNQRSYYPSISSNRWLAIRLESIGNMVVFFASLFAVVSRNSISSALVGLSLSHAMNITQSLNWMVRMSSECETNIVAVERIDEYTKIPQEREEEKDDLEGISSDTDKVTLATLSSTDTWPSHGVVEFKNYSARYREGLKLVLDNISFIIKSGEKVGVVGRTGAGKSSLTLSLFRIIEPFSGCIEIDGVNIQNVSLFTLRSSLSIIPQDPVIFFGTVRSNLDPFSLYTDSQIWAALEYCHLKNFVKGLDKQLDHEILEGGSNFSVGQRQLICLGRALLRKTKILILDEATAAVDLDTDKLIQETIRSEFRSCTILTIAHRINTILDNDKVLVLENGRVKEFDSPSVLLNEPSSLFYGLAKESNLVS